MDLSIYPFMLAFFSLFFRVRITDSSVALIPRFAIDSLSLPQPETSWDGMRWGKMRNLWIFWMVSFKWIIVQCCDKSNAGKTSISLYESSPRIHCPRITWNFVILSRFFSASSYNINFHVPGSFTNLTPHTSCSSPVCKWNTLSFPHRPPQRSGKISSIILFCGLVFILLLLECA